MIGVKECDGYGVFCVVYMKIREILLCI
jgi:hypothetical protein